MKITLTIAHEIYELISEEAQYLKCTVEELVEEILREAFNPWFDKSNIFMLSEKEVYRKMHPRLVETYLGKFVAISDGQLIDVDDDPQVLLQRLEEKGVMRESPYLAKVFANVRSDPRERKSNGKKV